MERMASEVVTSQGQILLEREMRSVEREINSSVFLAGIQGSLESFVASRLEMARQAMKMGHKVLAYGFYNEASEATELLGK